MSPLFEVLHKSKINITMETGFFLGKQMKKPNLRNLNEDLKDGEDELSLPPLPFP